MPQIRITAKQGQVEMEGQGFQGPACDTTIRELLMSMGVDPDTAHRETRPEYEMGIQVAEREVD
jgi:hypothetical protein